MRLLSSCGRLSRILRCFHGLNRPTWNWISLGNSQSCSTICTSTLSCLGTNWRRSLIFIMHHTTLSFCLGNIWLSNLKISCKLLRRKSLLKIWKSKIQSVQTRCSRSYQLQKITYLKAANKSQMKRNWKKSNDRKRLQHSKSQTGRESKISSWRQKRTSLAT